MASVRCFDLRADLQEGLARLDPPALVDARQGLGWHTTIMREGLD